MDIEAVFAEEFDKALAADVARSGLSIDKWFLGGVTKPETMVEQWRTIGPKAVQNFIDWWESSDYQVWITPDGRPAIELELDVMFGRVPVKMYVDLVCHKPGSDVLVVVDTKSGANVPDSVQQVALYACGIEKAYGNRPYAGAYFMARGAGRNKNIFLTEPVWLGKWEHSVEFFTQQFEAMERSIEASQPDLFIANVGKHCARCDVAVGCAAVGGWLAPKYDSAHPDFAG